MFVQFKIQLYKLYFFRNMIMYNLPKLTENYLRVQPTLYQHPVEDGCMGEGGEGPGGADRTGQLQHQVGRQPAECGDPQRAEQTHVDLVAQLLQLPCQHNRGFIFELDSVATILLVFISVLDGRTEKAGLLSMTNGLESGHLNERKTARATATARRERR